MNWNLSTEVTWAFTCSRVSSLVSRGWWSYSARCALCGHDHIIGELRLALVSYGLFYQRIFVFDMTYYLIRHFKLSLDILFNSCHFHDSFQEDIHGDWECRKRTLFVFILQNQKKKKNFVDIGSESWYTNNRPTYVFIFSQYEINERTFQLYSQ